MPTHSFRALGAVCLVLAGCWLAPVAAQAVDGVGHGRSATVRAVTPRHVQHQRTTPRTSVSPATAKDKPEAVAKAEPVTAADSTGAVTTTWTAAESAERACFRARRKLWQGDEGWVVKSVRVCP